MTAVGGSNSGTVVEGLSTVTRMLSSTERRQCLRRLVRVHSRVVGELDICCRSSSGRRGGIEVHRVAKSVGLEARFTFNRGPREFNHVVSSLVMSSTSVQAVTCSVVIHRVRRPRDISSVGVVHTFYRVSVGSSGSAGVRGLYGECGGRRDRLGSFFTRVNIALRSMVSSRDRLLTAIPSIVTGRVVRC